MKNNMPTEETTKQALPKRVRVARRIGTVGALLLGLGLYALFAENPGTIFPELENQLVAISVAVAGICGIIAEQIMKRPYYKTLQAKNQSETSPKEEP